MGARVVSRTEVAMAIFTGVTQILRLKYTLSSIHRILASEIRFEHSDPMRIIPNSYIFEMRKYIKEMKVEIQTDPERSIVERGSDI